MVPYLLECLAAWPGVQMGVGRKAFPPECAGERTPSLSKLFPSVGWVAKELQGASIAVPVAQASGGRELYSERPASLCLTGGC